MSCTKAPVGGDFLIEEGSPEQVLTPEQHSSEARLMARTVEEFVRREVQPLDERLEAHEEGLMRSLVQKAGELGVLGAGVPALYDGLGLPIPAIALLVERAALH